MLEINYLLHSQNQIYGSLCFRRVIYVSSILSDSRKTVLISVSAPRNLKVDSPLLYTWEERVTNTHLRQTKLK